MLPNIPSRTNECIFTLCTLAHQYLIYSYLFDCCDKVQNYLSSWTLQDPYALLFLAFSCKSMLIWRTQDLVKNFADESSYALIKGQWTQHCIPLARWSYFYSLIIVQYAWKIHRWVHGTPKILVLHNSQLCMEAGRGRGQWSFQVILFIIQMKTLFHYPWGSSNVLMSLTPGSSFWSELTALRLFMSQMMRDKRQTEGNNEKTGNYSIPTLL